jgi:hypothetical protein
MGDLKWSYAQLAAAMTREGCSISASSLQKSVVPRVKADGSEHYRPIRVDELAALARIFDQSMDALTGNRSRVNEVTLANAMNNLDTANRMLVAAVNTLLDAQIGLMTASQYAPPRRRQRIAEDAERRWQANSAQFRIQPRTADHHSVPISPEAVLETIESLRTLLSAVAADWRLQEAVRRQDAAADRQPAPTNDPQIGSSAWASAIQDERAWWNDPEPDDTIVDSDGTILTEEDRYEALMHLISSQSSRE